MKHVIIFILLTALYSSLYPQNSRIQWDSSYKPDTSEWTLSQQVSLKSGQSEFYLNLPLYDFVPEKLSFGIRAPLVTAGPLAFKGLYQFIGNLSRNSWTCFTFAPPIVLNRGALNMNNQGIALTGKHWGFYGQQKKDELRAGCHLLFPLFSAMINYSYGLSAPSVENDPWYDRIELPAGEMLHAAFMGKIIAGSHSSIGIIPLAAFSFSPFSAPGMSLAMKGHWRFSLFRVDLLSGFNSYGYRNIQGQQKQERGYVSGKLSWQILKDTQLYGSGLWSLESDTLDQELFADLGVQWEIKDCFILEGAYHHQVDLSGSTEPGTADLTLFWSTPKGTGSADLQYQIGPSLLDIKWIQNRGIHHWGLKAHWSESLEWDYLYWTIKPEHWEIRIKEEGLLDSVQLRLRLFF